MSKNRNRTKTKKVHNSKEYSIITKHFYHDYCYICARRSGSFYIDCSPQSMRSKGRHGNKRPIYTYKYREYKTWKYNRKTKWKQ